MAIKKSCRVTFADEKTEQTFLELNDEDEIKKYIQRAIEDIKENTFCGTQIPKRLIPVEYIKKYEVRNLWKYDLPQGWRLLYSITTPTKIEIISILIEWLNHKDYERRFRYILF